MLFVGVVFAAISVLNNVDVQCHMAIGITDISAQQTTVQVSAHQISTVSRHQEVLECLPLLPARLLHHAQTLSSDVSS